MSQEKRFISSIVNDTFLVDNEMQKLNIALNKSLIYSVIMFASFLRDKGYKISTTSTVSFCEMLSKFDVINRDEYKMICKSLFCSSPLEFESFEYYFDTFFSFDESIELQASLSKKQKEYDELLKKIQEDSLNNLNSKYTEMEVKASEIYQSVLTANFKVYKSHSQALADMNDSEKNELNRLIFMLDASNEDKLLVRNIVNLDKIQLMVYLMHNDLDYEKISSLLEQVMFLNFEHNNLMMVNEVLLESASVINKLDSEVNSRKNALNKELNQYKKDSEKSLKELKESAMSEINNLKVKLSTLKHRDEYLEGKNCVIEVIKNCDKTINSLTKCEYESFMSYIRLNSSKFRTKIGMSMRRDNSKIIDVKKTVQDSVKFNGNALKFYYKKPTIKKYKLLCVFDISGSVSKYLNLLSSFLFEINSVFNGGIEVYGFVSNLINFSEVFKSGSIQDAIDSVKGHRGYSSYEVAITDLYEECCSKIDSNTIIMYFGDARNNKNASKKDLLKELNSKAKYSVWLNPEVENKWDSGDSIISEYSTCINKVYCVNKTNDLINFLNDFSVSNE